MFWNVIKGRMVISGPDMQGKEQKDDRTKAGAVKVKKNRLARQYMNRRGGFNRPLPAERTGEKVQYSTDSCMAGRLLTVSCRRHMICIQRTNEQCWCSLF